MLLAVSACACAKPAAEAHKDGAGEAEKDAFGRLSIDELEARMAAAKAGQIKLAVYDNNARERFDRSHIAGAKWVSFDKVTAADLPPEKDATLVFYCANEH
jgi:3-mercaptopyruvate sulfurtransferase SseA